MILCLVLLVTGANFSCDLNPRGVLWPAAHLVYFARLHCPLHDVSDQSNVKCIVCYRVVCCVAACCCSMLLHQRPRQRVYELVTHIVCSVGMQNKQNICNTSVLISVLLIYTAAV